MSIWKKIKNVTPVIRAILHGKFGVVFTVKIASSKEELMYQIIKFENKNYFQINDQSFRPDPKFDKNFLIHPTPTGKLYQ